MTDREVMQQALGVLEAGLSISPESVLHDRLRERLAEPESEPEVWRYRLIADEQVVGEKYSKANWDVRYEPFGLYDVDHGGVVTKTPLYTAPPARCPLTDEEIDAVTRDRWGTELLGVMVQAHREYARAIERKITGGNDE